MVCTAAYTRLLTITVCLQALIEVMIGLSRSVLTTYEGVNISAMQPCGLESTPSQNKKQTAQIQVLL